MRFVYLGSRFTLRASSPRSVTLTQLRFACLAVASLAGDFHPEDRAHAGRTRKSATKPLRVYVARLGCYSGMRIGRSPRFIWTTSCVEIQ